jgi:type I restriction enzyme M protein
MHPAPKAGGEGSKIAIVFNGSPLFTGDAGSGESNIRRWIIENDWLDAVVALPDQMFYNTGIFTYVWLVTNCKPKHRQGKVLLIDGTRHFQKMKKSLGDKRNELSAAHIKELVRLYGEYEPDGMSTVLVDGQPESRVCSKIFRNQDFGFLKVTVERPLRLNFQVSEERVQRLWEQSAFVGLAESKKRKDAATIAAEEAAGRAFQQSVIDVLQTLDDAVLYRDRAQFLKVFDKAFKVADVKLAATVKKAILAALSERDQAAEICRNGKGEPEPDSELRDTEIVPLPEGYDDKQATGHDALVALVREHCEAYLQAEVLPHVPDAWIDYSKTKVGYEIPLNRHFYVYQPPRPLDVIEAEIKDLERETVAMLGDVV